MRGGYIRVSRQLLAHPIWRSEHFSRGQAWLDLLLRANFRDGAISVGNKQITIARGQVFTSQRQLAHRWRWNRKRVTAFLTALQSDDMIAIKTDRDLHHGYTLITINNYTTFQDREEHGRGHNGAMSPPENGATSGTTTRERLSPKNRGVARLGRFSRSHNGYRKGDHEGDTSKKNSSEEELVREAHTAAPSLTRGAPVAANDQTGTTSTDLRGEEIVP